MITIKPGGIPAITIILLVLAAFIGVRAGQPTLWETSGRTELLKGDARGVSISDTGVLMLSPKLNEIYNTQQTYVWSSAIDEQGNVYLGTGHDGKTFKVTANGVGSLLYDAPELDVTALAIGRDGAVFAGTSPDGKVYRIGPDGKADVFFDPGDKYIWSLAVMPDGSLAVGSIAARKHNADSRDLARSHAARRSDRGH
jgi:WD40 repeat protein